MNFAVELETDQPSSTLIISTSNDRPDGVLYSTRAVILPHDVAKAIRIALQKGWEPSEQTQPFEIELDIGTPIDEINNNKLE